MHFWLCSLISDDSERRAQLFIKKWKTFEQKHQELTQPTNVWLQFWVV